MNNNNSFPLGKGSWNGHDIYSIRFVGLAGNFRKFLSTLVEDFNSPHFGANNELWDENTK